MSDYTDHVRSRVYDRVRSEVDRHAVARVNSSTRLQVYRETLLWLDNVVIPGVADSLRIRVYDQAVGRWRT